MTLRSTKRLVWISSGMMLLASPLMLSWAALTPVDQFGGATQRAQATVKNLSEGSGLRQLPSEQDLQKLTTRRLRAPLFDLPPKPLEPAKQPKPPAALPYKLVGTMIEAGQSPLAIFQDAKAQDALHGEGDVLDGKPNGPKIVRIGADSVDLEHQGRQITLRLDESDP